MANHFITVSFLSIASLLPLSAGPVDSARVEPAIYRPAGNQSVELTPVVEHRRYHRRHARRKTIKRVGVGAAGGAAIGALAGGGPGAAIGAAAGAGAGALYDHHEKSKGK